MSAVVAVLAAIGAMSVVASVGWFLFCWRTAASGDYDPAEPSPLATWQASRDAYRNVRVLRTTSPAHGGNAVDLTGTPIPWTGPMFATQWTANAPVTLTHYLVGDNVIDLRDEATTTTGDIA